jgi:ATP-dependent HslUV protease ATP-binding subunit HslU
MQNLTPAQIVAALDRYIIGQDPAKRAVAVAIRNRWRRQHLAPDVAREVLPKNIIMIGPTGVGKTEIARRLANLTGAPFLKVEASKYTEVGYHGRDVESMIRDLLDQALAMVRAEKARAVADQAADTTAWRLVDLLLPAANDLADTPSADLSDATASPPLPLGEGRGEGRPPGPLDLHATPAADRARVRQRLRAQLDAGELDGREVEVVVTSRPASGVLMAGMGLDQMDPEVGRMLERLIPEQTRRRRVPVAEARRILAEQETDKLLDQDKITAEALARTQEQGIIFLDEIDKITAAGTGGSGGTGGSAGGSGPDVSRQGVQRDLLPIVEGSAVNTRHGVVHTDHILFIAAGAFHGSSVRDLMPELQGRFPIRVELSALTRDDLARILREPRNALPRQQQQLLAVEGLQVTFEPGALDAMADLAAQANATLENIGARRLMTVVEKVFEQINFDAPDLAARGETSVRITADFVRRRLTPPVGDQDPGRFVL